MLKDTKGTRRTEDLMLLCPEIFGLTCSLLLRRLLVFHLILICCCRQKSSHAHDKKNLQHPSCSLLLFRLIYNAIFLSIPCCIPLFLLFHMSGSCMLRTGQVYSKWACEAAALLFQYERMNTGETSIWRLPTIVKKKNQIVRSDRESGS